MKQLVVMAMLLLPTSAWGQGPEDASSARVRLGPLGLTPSVSVSNLGIDNNVFNESEQGDPDRDFTATVSPRTDFWLRLGRGALSGAAQVDYVHYQKFQAERAVNTRGNLRLEVALGRLTPYIAGGAIRARERPGYEIDARARRLENSANVGADLRIGVRSSVGVAVWRTRIRFDADEIFRGSSLSERLNRRVEGARLSVSRNLTPLTTVFVELEAQRDRFDLSPVRDADTLRVMPGVSFAPFALVTGQARVGFRSFKGRSPSLPDFRGVIAGADLAYTLLGRTRFTFQAERDLRYSYEVTEPYYVQTGATVGLTQQIIGRWDVGGRLGRYQLDYRRLEGAGEPRLEHLRTVGVGMGYRIGPSTRLGLDVDKQWRTADRAGRTYEGFRVGTSVGYGF